jgi:transposase InsO family protein
MPWQEVSTMSLRQEFITMVQHGTVPFSELCRRFQVSRKTGYKWLARFTADGEAGLTDRSRRPHSSPRRTPVAMEAAVVAVRDTHPAWGGRKLRRRLQDVGYREVPAPSTLTAILYRHGRIEAGASQQHTAFTRFEHEAPNQLWQMDFKGHFALAQGRCHPLTVLDDHSRFNLLLRACANEQGETVQAALTETFRRYGLPERMTMDHGAPWGADPAHPLTAVTVWLIRLGIRVGHSRPYHPQTQGKDERFHRTLAVECLRAQVLRDLAHCQGQFDRFRQIYNFERPHDALGLAVPASRYAPSSRAFPAVLPPIEYGPGDAVRKVQGKGEIHYAGRVFRLSRALHGYPVAVRSTPADGRLAIYFCHYYVTEIDLRCPDA